MQFDKTLCCGCGACANICPVDAIEWVCSEKGFMEPSIDQARCIDCGMCRKVCPYETNHVGCDADPKIYAAIHKDPEVVRASSSGGVFTALSDRVLEQGGVVYGVAFDEAWRLDYRRAESASERDAFRGSKYVQADGKEIFAQVARDLGAGNMVMFTGTPCQVSAMRLYLSAKNVPTEQFYSVDNICHGVASPQVWQDYLSYIEGHVLKGTQIVRFNMRSKKEAWQSQVIDCETDAGDESAVLNAQASWNKLYRTTFATRESCYHCRYTSYDRVGDLTCADFWNIENAGLDIDYSNGVSLVLVNTEKGESWLADCMEDLVCVPSNKKAAWQIHLERSQPASNKRHAFWESYAKDSSATIARFGRGSRFNAFARGLTPLLRKIGLYTLAVRALSVMRSITNRGSKNEQ